MKKIFLIFALSVISVQFAYPAVKHQVTKDGINIRADSTISSDSLGFLNSGDIVEVIQDGAEWAKIILPKHFSCYAAGRYIKKYPGHKGKVIASNLNLRNKPLPDAYVIGKAPEGAIFALQAENKNWVKIRPYPYVKGWVHKKFLSKYKKKRGTPAAVGEIVAKLSEPDMKKKGKYHQDLVEMGEKIMPLLESYLPIANINTAYSIILVLTQLGQTNPKLALHFLKKIDPDKAKISGIYLDIAQDIIQPKESRVAYFYQAENGHLSPDDIEKSRLSLQKEYINNN